MEFWAYRMFTWAYLVLMLLGVTVRHLNDVKMHKEHMQALNQQCVKIALSDNFDNRNY